jgi:hypothetical protein
VARAPGDREWWRGTQRGSDGASPSRRWRGTPGDLPRPNPVGFDPGPDCWSMGTRRWPVGNRPYEGTTGGGWARLRRTGVGFGTPSGHKPEADAWDARATSGNVGQRRGGEWDVARQRTGSGAAIDTTGELHPMPRQPDIAGRGGLVDCTARPALDFAPREYRNRRAVPAAILVRSGLGK